MATYDDSYEERQEDEVNFLQAVFPGDFRDLRHADPWKVGEAGRWRRDKLLALHVAAEFPDHVCGANPRLTP